MSSLKKSVMQSLKWVAFSKICIQAFRWAATFWVITLLTPDDYAVMALTDLATGYLLAFSSLGLGALLVSKKTLSLRFKREMLFLSYVVNTLLFAIQFFIAPILADVFNNQNLTLVLQASACCYLLNIFTLIPSSMMARNMEFKKRSLIEMAGGLSSAVVVVGLAYAQFGYWALALSYITNEIVRSVMYFATSNEVYIRPNLPRKRSLKLMRYCLSVSLSELFFHVRDSIDVVICGLFLSKHQLGVYNVSLQVSNMPLRKISPPIRAVAVPALSRLRNDQSRLLSHLIKIQRLGFFITVPIFWGIASVIDLLVPLVIGEKWLDTVEIIALICIVLPFRFGEEMLHPILKGMQKGKEMMIANLVALFTFGGAVYGFVTNFGLIGVAYGWLVSTPIIYFVSTFIVSRPFGNKMSDISYEWLKPCLSGLFMVLTVYSLKHSLPVKTPEFFALIVCAVSGATAYLVASLLVHRHVINELKALRGN